MNPDEVLDSISKFVYWLAHRVADGETPLMDFDEIVGELNLEIVKGMGRYADKPMNELLALLRKMCDNRIAELRYKYYKTHRVAARFTLSIDFVTDTDGAECYYQPPVDDAVRISAVAGSAFRVAETRRRLSSIAATVFDNVILDDNSRVADQIALAGMRAANAYKSGGTVRIKPRHVAAALPGLSENAVKLAFAEIRNVYKEVRKEYG